MKMRRLPSFTLPAGLKVTGGIAWPRVRISMACGEPDPPKWWHVYFGTHPTLLQLIDMAEAWKRGER